MKRPANTMDSGFAWSAWFIAILLLGTAAGSPGDQPTLDELLEITPPGADAVPDAHPQEDHAPSHVDPQVSRVLSGAGPGDVFDQAVQQMEQAADRLDQYRDVGLKTQRLQQEIIAKLDQVIAMARQQQSQSGSSGSSGSSGQAQQQQDGSVRNTGQQMTGGSQGAIGQGASPGDASAGGREADDRSGGAMQSNRTEWGNLPARLRDELQQGINERFSTMYREMTGAYYRRLAEQGE